MTIHLLETNISVKEPAQSIYVDSFVAYGLTFDL